MTLRYRYRKQILIGFVILLIFGITGVNIYKFYPKKKPKKEETEILVTKKKEESSKNKESMSQNEKRREESQIMVDVKGYVNNPGIYKLEENSRVIDAITIAGGVTGDADTSVLNLSKKLKDEMVIIVYNYEQVANFKIVKQEEFQVQEQCQTGINGVTNDACIESSKKETIENKKVSINTATLEELMTLEGVGESKAKAIIEYRNTNGDFQKIEDLLNVSGIGESIFAKIKENITL